MVLLRRTLSCVLLFSFCLIVCILPVSAVDYEIIESIPGDFSYTNIQTAFNCHDYDAAVGFQKWKFLPPNPNTELSFVYEGGNELWMHLLTSYNDPNVSTYSPDVFGYPTNGGLLCNFYLDESADLDFTQLTSNIFLDGYSSSGEVAKLFVNPETFNLEYSVDDDLISSVEADNILLVESVVCDNVFSVYIDFTTQLQLVPGVGTKPVYVKNEYPLTGVFELKFTGSALVEVPSVIDKVEIINGQLDEVTGQLDEIYTSVFEIENGVAELVQQIDHISGTVDNIDQTVSDTNEQLKDPDSSIWQAAGSAISGAIEDLFVPSQEDITSVKQGFDELAEDKLGGAYTAMETVEDTITIVNDKLNNPSAAEGVEFPGIAVPLGGDVGTVVLAERQMVTLPLQLTAILHPVAGTIISIICGLGTFNVLKDMVECFLSGFSYAAYLHRNKGGSDE